MTTPYITLPTITIPKQYWMHENQRLHHMDRAHRTKYCRQVAAYTYRSFAPIQLGWPVWVIALIAWPTAGRVDPPNAYPTIKALIDGGTDTGLWPDDDTKHVQSVSPLRAERKSAPHTYDVTLTITPAPALLEALIPNSKPTTR